MTDKKKGAPDPFATWQKMVQDWETEINTWSARFTQNEQFSAVMGQTTKMMIVAQKAMTEKLEGVLQNLNLPSKTQIETLADRLDSIEDSIAQLRIALDKLANTAAPAPDQVAHRRTRVPTSKTPEG